MNPNYNQTITLYNCLKAADNPGKKDIWYRTVLEDCFYKAIVSRTESGKEIGMSNTYTVRIPQSVQYKHYYEWIGLPDTERGQYFTVHMDDIVVCDECLDEITGITGSAATDILRRYKPDAFKITAFSDNTSFIADKHYRIGG